MLTPRFHLSGCLFLMITLLGLDAHAVTTGDLRTYSTLHSIGIEWDVGSDDNHNATCQVRYRKTGSSSWLVAQPLFRVDFKSTNMLAGSLLFLDPGTAYEVDLQVADQDGGNTQRTVTLSTRSVPTLPNGGRTYHVSPGSGGGSGTASNPFLGMATAQNRAQPGDTFLIHAGSYPGETELTVSGEQDNYIVWKGAGDGKTVFETLRINADHIWLEGLHVEGHEYGIRTYNEPEDVVISKNNFTGCHYCVYLNHGGDGWYIADNVIYGDVLPASGDFGGEGIELNHSSNHTVAHNSITHVADGVSYPGTNCDIFGNEIFDVSDDGVEPDYGKSNNRVWGNRISNALHSGSPRPTGTPGRMVPVEMPPGKQTWTTTASTGGTTDTASNGGATRAIQASPYFPTPPASRNMGSR